MMHHETKPTAPPAPFYTNNPAPGAGVTYVHQQAVPPSPPPYYAPPSPVYQASQSPIIFQQPQYTIHPATSSPPTIIHSAQPVYYVQSNTTGQSPISTRVGTTDDDIEDACCMGATAGLGALLCCLALQSSDRK